VIVDPPLEDGAVQDSATLPALAFAVRNVGASGTAAGVADAAGDDSGPSPWLFVAVTS